MAAAQPTSRRAPSVHQQGFSAVLRTADALRRALAVTLEPHGLTAQQYNVLRILRGARPDPLPTMEIAQRMMEQAPGITRLVDRLQAKGLVDREQHVDDRRRVLCSITARGLDLLAELDEQVDQLDESLLGVLSDSDLRELIGQLERIRDGG